MVTLQGGILKDDKGRTGYIAANRQFQFDGPPQTGAIYTAGWSVCGNGSLAIGNDAVFYACKSGGFSNLYDENQAAQCSQVYINLVNGGASAGVPTQSSDGQPGGKCLYDGLLGRLPTNTPLVTSAASSAGSPSQISDVGGIVPCYTRLY